ncbi:unnamed protein product [Amaranthus hypochondriacus]
MLYFIFPYVVTAQDQHSFPILIVPLQNSEVGSNRWLYFCFGLVIGVSVIVVIGVILYYIFGKGKLNGLVPSEYFIEAPEKAFVKQLPESFHGEHVVSEKI